MKKYLKTSKKISAVIIAVMIMLSSVITVSVTAFASDNKNALFGDADENGILNSSDARILLRCSIGIEETTQNILTYCDYTRDGSITSEDARTALRVAVDLESAYCIFMGHSVEPFTIKADCINDGYTVKKCKRCSYTQGEKYDIVKASGHCFTEKTNNATCTEDGIFIRECSVCSYVAEKKTVEKAKGHSFGFWQVKGNTKEKVCKNCNFREVSDNVKTIYLTFDDGPGPYTEKLLGYLRKYGVKATFFVTNQMPKYRYLLPVIVNDGHAIGVHTLTHQWSIYSGTESYLRDFNAMHKIIFEDTGVDTNIFRFPGGTNNTVSRSYCRGIMKSMSAYMTESGYIYYDWNVDCGDTLGYNSSKIASTVINGIRNRNFSIVLMHDIKYNTVEAIPTIIEYCLRNGYEFAVIDESTPMVQFSPVN